MLGKDGEACKHSPRPIELILRARGSGEYGADLLVDKGVRDIGFQNKNVAQLQEYVRLHVVVQMRIESAKERQPMRHQPAVLNERLADRRPLVGLPLDQTKVDVQE